MQALLVQDVPYLLGKEPHILPLRTVYADVHIPIGSPCCWRVIYHSRSLSYSGKDMSTSLYQSPYRFAKNSTTSGMGFR